MKTTGNTTTALLTALIYTLTIGAGMYVMHDIYGASYGEPEMMYVLWAVEIILTLIAVYAVSRFGGWAQLGFGPLQWRQMVWLLPAIVILLLMWRTFFVHLGNVTLSPDQWRLLALSGFTTALVGFSEEVIYRGIVLHVFLRHRSVWVAMGVSAIAFSLLHAVNVLGGVSLLGMSTQLALTGLVGFFLAPVALKLKNLWPLILWHWLWDFVLFAGNVSGADIGSWSLLMIVNNLVLGGILWFLVGRAARKVSV